jgi:hypothetical protein
MTSSDLLDCFQVDDELELHRPLHRRVGGFSAFQKLVYLHGGAPPQKRHLAPEGVIQRK